MLYFIRDESVLMQCAQVFANALAPGICVYLYGDLGAGKTTLVRAILNNLGVNGRVKSPTYTLMETYPVSAFTVCHCDLYRVQDESELQYLGLDVLDDQTVYFIEWPQKASALFPDPHLKITLRYDEQGDENRRYLDIVGHGKSYGALIAGLQAEEIPQC